MGLAEPEADFPRSYSTDKKSDVKVKSKRKTENDLFGDGKKKIKLEEGKKKPEKASKKKTENVVWQTIITYDVLNEGVMGVGIVIEIAEDHLLLEVCDNCRVRLQATQIGKIFTNILKQGEETLEDFFEIGQMIPFRVTKRSTKDEKTGKTLYPEVTCDPSKLNSHLVPSTLFPGLVIHSIVESLEEKGCVLNIGLMAMKGFLSKDKFPSCEIKVGKPLVVRIEAATSRVLNVSAFVEQDTLSHDASEKLQLNHLMPGTVVECDPEEGSRAAGVFVNIGNGIRGFIARKHLPPRLRTDTSKLVKTIRGVVMFCQQNSNLLVISAHPDIVAISKPEKRRNFDNLEIGDLIKCHVIDVVSSKFRVVFSLPNGADGKPSLITATASKNYLEGAENCEKIYKIGSEHDCRVLGFHYSERSIIVATKKEILKQKMVSFKDAVPGELVTAKVKRVTSNGIFVTIFETVYGYMPTRLISDKAVSVQKAYPIGKEFKCRIWYVDVDRKQVIVTAKQALIDHKGTKINDIDEKFVGKTAVGVVAKVFDKGSLLVSFYNKICGILPAKEAGKLTTSQDKSLLVKVKSVDTENNKMLLSADDDGTSEQVAVQMPQDKAATKKQKEEIKEKKKENEENASLKKSIKNFNIYTGAISGAWAYNEIGSYYCVKVDLPSGNIGRLHVSEFPEKFGKQTDAKEILAAFLKEYNYKKITTRVIGMDDIILNGQKKRVFDLTMLNWKLCFPKIREKQLGYKQSFKNNTIVTCYAIPENDAANIKVEINPRTTGVIPREQFTSHLLKNETSEGGVVNAEDQSCVIPNVAVTGCSRKKKRFSLNLKISDSKLTKADNEQPKNKIETNITSKRSNFEFGHLITGRVTNVNHTTFGVAVSLSTGQQAMLGSTGISVKYELVQKFLKKFHKGELYNFYPLRQDEHPRRLFVITEGRYKHYMKDPNAEEPTALMLNLTEVAKNEGKEVYGFLCNNSGPSYSLVEIAPGIRGIIKKTETTKNLPLNTILAVTIQEVDIENKRIQLVFQKVVKPATAQKVAIESDMVSKGTKCHNDTKENISKGEKMEIDDPGFDWNNVGFTPDELAAVGRIENKNETKTELKTNQVKSKKEESETNNERKDFDQLLKKEPNSASIWIEYMSYFLEKGDIEKARATAERALTVMNHREEAEIFNLWTAYLNLEVAFGDEDSATAIFQRACGSANGLKVHKQMAAILNKNRKIEEADEIFKAMIRKFRASSEDVWVLYADHLMSTERPQEGRDLLQRALASVPQQGHPLLITRFAQLEYLKGDAERGRTLFESLVAACPKKTDIWMVYADLSVKYNGIETARQVLERACSVPFNSHKMKSLFTKWMDFETKYGDEKSQNLVKSRAERFISNKKQEME